MKFIRVAQVFAALTCVLMAVTAYNAVGQTVAPVVPSQVPVPQTVININEILAPWLPILMTAVMGVILALLELIRQWVKKRTNVQIDETYMKVIQVALDNAAGRAVMQLSDRLRDVNLDVHSPVIKQAVEYVNQAASDSVKHFDLDSDQIAEKIIAKIGVITAPNPVAFPKDVTPPPPDPGAGG